MHYTRQLYSDRGGSLGKTIAPEILSRSVWLTGCEIAQFVVMALLRVPATAASGGGQGTKAGSSKVAKRHRRALRACAHACIKR